MRVFKLLIVDDEEEIRDIVKSDLSALDCEIIEAGNGREALSLIESHTFDAILCDIKMPEMDGLEFLRQLRAKGEETPLVVLTAYGDKQNTLQALRCSATDFIEKPYEVEKLIKLMEEVLKVGRFLNTFEEYPSKEASNRLKKAKKALLQMRLAMERRHDEKKEAS